MLVNTYMLEHLPEVGIIISGIARKCLILTMFFIGASLSMDKIKTVGLRPLKLGILLWVIISVVSLTYILWLRG